MLEQLSDIEQDVGGSDAAVNTVTESQHDSESEMEEILDSQQTIEEDSAEVGNYFLSRHTARTGPKIKWSRTPPSKAVRTRAHNILSQLPGVKRHAQHAQGTKDCFHLFFNTEVIELLVMNTNLYIDKIKENYQRDRDASPTDAVEVHAFLGLLIMAGVLRASHLNYIDLWAHDGSGVEIFRLTMSYKRFLFLLRCLRFDNIFDRPARQTVDNLAAIRNLCDILNRNFVASYSPSENVTIDEQLIAFRGRFKGKVYMPNKPNKFGIKV